MNNKYRAYITTIAAKFQKDCETHRGLDEEIRKFSGHLASICYNELARILDRESK